MPLKPRQVDSALQSKGFRLVDGDHHRYVLYVGGRMTEIRTKVSHNSRDLGEDLIHKMAHQTHLSKPDFLNLIECSLSGPEYLARLREAGFHLEPERSITPP